MKKKSHQTLRILFPVFSSKSITSHFQFTLTSVAYIPTRTLSNIFLPVSCISFRLILVEHKHPSKISFTHFVCLHAHLLSQIPLKIVEQKHRNILCVFVCTVLCYKQECGQQSVSSVISPSLRTGQNTQKVTSKTDVWLLYFFNT